MSAVVLDINYPAWRPPMLHPTDPKWHAPEMVALAVYVKPEDGTITDVGPYRHSVHWAEDNRPASVTYCNNCGGVFTFEAACKLEPNAGRMARFCGSCKVFQGWSKQCSQ
jgi:hypothetical protein